MSVTRKALFVIERNHNRDLTLAQIAAACDVSKYHLAHAFGQTTQPVRYAIHAGAAADRGGTGVGARGT